VWVTGGEGLGGWWLCKIRRDSEVRPLRCYSSFEGTKVLLYGENFILSDEEGCYEPKRAELILLKQFSPMVACR